MGYKHCRCTPDVDADAMHVRLADENAMYRISSTQIVI